MDFTVISWPMLVLALVHELRGELHHVPRFERPFWVMEQLELALVEGLGQRIVWAATGRRSNPRVLAGSGHGG